MNALVRKDCYVLMKQMKMFLIAILLFSALPNLSANIFGVVYAAMLPYSSIAYDERSKWNQLAAMLPYSHRDMVVSKYVLGYLFIAAAAVLTIVFQTVLRPFTHSTVGMAETLLTFCTAACLIALTLPFVFRFGVEKGRMLFIFVVIGVSAFAGSTLTIAGETAIPMALHFALPLAAVVLNVISIPLSIRLFAKRNW